MKTIKSGAAVILAMAALAPTAQADNNGLGGLVTDYVGLAQGAGVPFGAAVSAASKVTDSGMAQGDEAGIDILGCDSDCNDPGVGNAGRYSKNNNGNEGEP